jgi:hypothetical protein
MSIDTSKGHPAMDYAEHNRTYHGFLTATKWGVIVMAALMIGMYIFLV